ncbi:MAG: TetR/AcrR family transcriptional regulator [Paraburkholderia tropica]|uniref:TetR family transcriptional regulator n=1 Tax=Paraburkholderia tropica TaxID=92647 RepID=A0AAQ1GD58_9BURK|nr:TetR/AcrR family transcriptional regulator [Paraburkholderia tropica]MBB2980321.1 TetR/AcrR family transcriptional repressor of nem operon [Paraburkholderia tropica]MBB3000423.1 TetR/AcrR family transcriptional repressor of nem operon [Paraburkholderia tropica]MBB6320052.1 TetR/AcrR family transcriptional repressor of nem operon [Paraburkholderia tropica]MDE1144673.1 TetR/AcrR family transcriptional regulator [Paraburkholderia tropica]PXX17563.1 TetR family transcriptional regulator [Parabu
METINTPETADVREKIIAIGQSIIGAKGFAAVGLSEILAAAGVPKGSFYYYFASKDAFGVALLENYFEDYLAELDKTLSLPGMTMAARLMQYWQIWRETQSFFDCQGKCLAVKLGAEVADMSEPMRAALNRGTAGVVARLARAIEAGVAEGSLTVDAEPRVVAQSLYQLWLGASVMVKIVRNLQPFEVALETTRRTLHLPV